VTLKDPTMNTIQAATSIALLLGLCACGGGGGGGAGAAGATAGGGTASTQSFAQVVPGSTMTWNTAQNQDFQVTVNSADGALASGAAVRLFSMSTTSPHDGSTLDQPVPKDLIDNAVTGGDGKATFSARLPAHLTDVLVVATWQDQRVVTRVALTRPQAPLTVTTAQ
jgi:hypothetical protein